MTRITVLGTGYLGATHAACMAELGNDVLGVDSDPGKISSLRRAETPFFEPGLHDLVAKHVASGRLRFTQSMEEAAAFGDIHFLCVGTPQLESGHGTDMRFVDGVVDEIGPYLHRPALFVGKSTVPVGTAERLTERLTRLAPAGAAVEVAWNPEFLREGHAVADTLRPDRIVIGVASETAEQKLRALYAPLADAGVPFVVTDFATAELVKVAANAFLSTKISFINATAEVCEAAGADVYQLASALSYDPRIGGNFLSPGIGFGGGCLPKDLRAFVARADELGVGQALRFLKDMDAINNRSRKRMVDLARRECGDDFSGKRVAVWGAAFKPDSDDVRDSPALSVAEAIRAEGGRVTVYDPRANDNARKAHPELYYADDALDAAAEADVLLHATEWNEFRTIDPHSVGAVIGSRRVVDGRGSLDEDRWRAAGWTYRALGKPRIG